MKCVYCGQEKKGSREHILSKAVLDLFPECYLTFGYPTNKVHDSDPVIKDVCGDCNSKISYIDAYARDFISSYFVIDYPDTESVSISYDYALVQKMLLKFAFNDLRSHKEDVSFFDDELRSYIKDDTEITPKKNVVVMAGIAVNLTPAHNFVFGNKKLQMIANPVLLDEPLVDIVDFNEFSIELRNNPKELVLDDLRLSYVFRFNSGQFVLLCFDKNAKNLENMKTVLKYSYPYALLDEHNHAELPLCTGYCNYHIPGIILQSWDPSFELSARIKLLNNSDKEWKELESRFLEYEKQLAQEHPR